jgi:hypothetical protein
MEADCDEDEMRAGASHGGPRSIPDRLREYRSSRWMGKQQ